MLAKRIKVLGGRVPGSLDLERDQKFLQPPEDSTDLTAVIKGVIEAEEGAIAQYEKIIRLCDQVDLSHRTWRLAFSATSRNTGARF